MPNTSKHPSTLERLKDFLFARGPLSQAAGTAPPPATPPFVPQDTSFIAQAAQQAARQAGLGGDPLASMPIPGVPMPPNPMEQVGLFEMLSQILGRKRRK